jgi:hypothetical protein
MKMISVTRAHWVPLLNPLRTLLRTGGPPSCLKPSVVSLLRRHKKHLIQVVPYLMSLTLVDFELAENIKLFVNTTEP